MTDRFAPSDPLDPFGYVVDPFTPVRRRTREVRVGKVGIGGE